MARPERLLPHFAQQVAHGHRDIAKVNFDRARRLAFVAHRAVVGHVFKLLPMFDAHPTASLFFVQKGFNQQRGCQNFVARAVEQISARHMSGAHRFALAATQAIFDAVGNVANVRLLHDERFMPHQAKTGGVGLGEVGRAAGFMTCDLANLLAGAHQLAAVEVPLGVHAHFVVGKGLQLCVAQKLQLGNANAVFTRNDAIQRPGQGHDALDSAMRHLQHVVVVAIDRNVGVHIAVTGVHVQGDPNLALEHTLVYRLDLQHQWLKRTARKHIIQRLEQLQLPAGAQRVVLQGAEQLINAVGPVLPLGLHLMHQALGRNQTLVQQVPRGHMAAVILAGQIQQLDQINTLEERIQLGAQTKFVVQAQLDVDAVNAIGVFGHAVQGNHHVFIDFEGVGVPRNGRCTLAVEPEFFARIRVDGNEALAASRVGNAHHL